MYRYIYLIEVLTTFKKVALVVTPIVIIGYSAKIMLLLFGKNANPNKERIKAKKYFRDILTTIVILLLILIFIPNKDTMYKMYFSEQVKSEYKLNK